MTRKLIITNDDGREFEHGELILVNREGPEKTIKININLVMVDDIEALQEDIEEIIKRYAI